jgi:hypothetical protein
MLLCVILNDLRIGIGGTDKTSVPLLAFLIFGTQSVSAIRVSWSHAEGPPCAQDIMRACMFWRPTPTSRPEPLEMT